MKSSKTIVLTGFLLFSLLSYSQQASEIDALFNKVLLFYQTNNIDHKTHNRQLSFNKDLRILKIDSMQIAFDEVEIKYEFFKNENRSEHIVFFSCIGHKSCIKSNNKNSKGIIGYGTEFKDESDCKEFINLISDLKKSLPNKTLLK